MQALNKSPRVPTTAAPSSLQPHPWWPRAQLVRTAQAEGRGPIFKAPWGLAMGAMAKHMGWGHLSEDVICVFLTFAHWSQGQQETLCRAVFSASPGSAPPEDSRPVFFRRCGAGGSPGVRRCH